MRTDWGGFPSRMANWHLFSWTFCCSISGILSPTTGHFTSKPSWNVSCPFSGALHFLFSLPWLVFSHISRCHVLSLFLNFPSLPGYLRIAFVPVTCYPPVLPHLELWNTHCSLKLCSLHLYLWMVSSIRKQVLWPQRVSVFHSLLCPSCLEKCFELSRCSTNIRWKKKWIKLRRNIICNLVTKIVPCAKYFVINIDKL